MAIKTISSIILLFANGVLGQTANDYFHTGAQFYVHGKNQECKMTLAEGLSKFPNDPKMSALKAKIKEEEKQNQNKQNQNQDKQDKNKQDQNKDQKNKEDKKQDQQQNQDQNKKDQEKQKPEPTPQQQKQKDMKKDEAKRIIEQFSDDDKDLKKKPEKTGIAGQKKVEKDW